MPPKAATRSQVGSASADSSASSTATLAKGAGTTASGGERASPPPPPVELPPIIDTFNSDSFTSIVKLSPSALAQFIYANCGKAFDAHRESWIQKGFDGAMLLRIAPQVWDAEIQKEFPKMGITFRISLFNFIKQVVARDMSVDNTCIKSELCTLWAQSTFDDPARARIRSIQNTEGGTTGPAFKRSAMSYTFGGFPQVGLSAPPFGENAPSLGNFALPFGDVAPSTGLRAPPPGGNAPPPGLGALPLGDSAPPPNRLRGPPCHNDDLPVHSLAELHALLRSSGVVSKPWEIASALRPKSHEIDFVPGFKRISMYALIEQSKAAAATRRAAGEQMALMNKDISWPKMKAFDKKSFLWARAKFYESVLLSLPSGIFSTFKETLCPSARSACLDVFKLDESDFLALGDKVFLEWCLVRFSPQNKAQALLSLSAVKLEEHFDSKHSQASFVAKLDSLKYEFELCVNDAFDMAKYWPTDESNDDFGVLTLKEVMIKWLGCFPNQYKPAASVQIDHCRNFIASNKDMLFCDQVSKLRSVFVSRDTKVFDGDMQYTTLPSSARPQDTRAGGAARPRPFPAVAAVPRPPFAGQPRSAHPGATTQTKPTWNAGSRPARPPVPGIKRCKGCGAENNHWGLGFTKDS